MAVPPSDKVPTTKLYRTQYLRQSIDGITGYSIRSKKVNDGIIYYIHYLYFRAQNNGSWYAPLEFNFTEDVPFYLDAAASSGVVDLYVYVNGQQYTFTKAAGYQVQCAMASYSPYTDVTWPFTTSTIPPLYDPAYTDTEATPIVINKLTQSQYESITPDNTQLYLVTDANFETTNHKVQTIDENSTNTQYPSATAVNDVKYRGEPFYIEADGGAISFTINGTMSSKHIAYSFDKVTWTDTTIQNLIVNVPSTKRVYFHSNDTIDLAVDSGSHVINNYAQFSVSDDYQFEVGGRLDSLFNYASAGKTYKLFQNTSLITSAKNLDVNHDGTACVCDSMFSGAYVLEKAPVLSATTLPSYAYSNMFVDCSTLGEAPALPAETLSTYCYESMFAGCTSLRNAPPIMAKTLATYCCQNMFQGCTSLETAPELRASSVVMGCYDYMFSGCTSLRQIPRLPATTLAAYCYRGMFSGCSSLYLSPDYDSLHYNIFKVPDKTQINYSQTWKNKQIVFGSPNIVTVTFDKNSDSQGNYVIGEEVGGSSIPGVRYLKNTINGSSANIYNHWCEIKIWYNGSNIAQGKNIIDDNGVVHSNTYATDNVVNPSYYDGGSGRKSITVDLGAVYQITGCTIWHYYPDGRTYYENVTEVSPDGENWFVIDCASYQETSSGHEITLDYSNLIMPSWSIKGSSVEGFIDTSAAVVGEMVTGIGAGTGSSSTLYYLDYAYDTIPIASSSNDSPIYRWNNTTTYNNYKTLQMSQTDYNLLVYDGRTELYDSTKVTYGYYINTSGTMSSDHTSMASDYIPVTPGATYTWIGKSSKAGTNNKRVVGYTSNTATTGTAINAVAVTGMNIAYTNTFTVPSNMTYIRLSLNAGDRDVSLTLGNAAPNLSWKKFVEVNATVTIPEQWSVLNTTYNFNFKSNDTDYSSFQVDSSGHIYYDEDLVYFGTGWKDDGYLYDRNNIWRVNDIPQFIQAYKIVIWKVTSNVRTEVWYTWEGLPSTIKGNNSWQITVNGTAVVTLDSSICNWQIWSLSGSNSSGYATKTAITSPYKTITTTFDAIYASTSNDWKKFNQVSGNVTSKSTSTTTDPGNALYRMFYQTQNSNISTPVINKAYFTNAVLIPEANEAQTNVMYPEIWWADTLVTSGQGLYSLLTATTFNGTSDYIDTNVKVLNGDPTFSIFVDFQQTALVSDMREVIHCNTEVSPYPGLSLDINPPSYTRLAYYNKVNNYTRDTNRHRAIITHTAGAKNVCTWYYDDTTAIPTTGTTAYSNVDRNLLIGCYQDANGNKGRFLNGTIYSCIVVDRIFTSTEISSLMSGNIPSTINWSVKNQTLSVRFICNGTLYNKLYIDIDGSMYYGQNNVYTIVYNVNTDTWTDSIYKKIQSINPISSTFINEWGAFLSQSKLY